MKRFGKIVTICMCVVLFTALFYGCGEKSEESGEDVNTEFSEDPYENYIHDALEAVRDNAQVLDGNDQTAGENTPSEEGENTGNGRVIQIERGTEEDAPQPVYVSSEIAEPESEETSKEGEESEDETSKEKEKAPETFEVGTGLVYIDGKYDETYRTELLKTINDARTGLNYPAMTINTSLNKCADLRAKEVTCFLSHMRPDGSMFYSLAPNYYKAEIITVDSANPKETLDAWMTDPISRSILFSKDFTSIGASNYICNGLNCIVVSFGY